MDKKLPQNLDPKLKEAYERIMSTSYSREVAITPPSLPVTPQIPTPSEPTTTPPTPKPISSVKTETVSVPQKTEKHNSLMIVIVLGIIFIVVYGLFWIKFFGVGL